MILFSIDCVCVWSTCCRLQFSLWNWQSVKRCCSCLTFSCEQSYHQGMNLFLSVQGTARSNTFVQSESWHLQCITKLTLACCQRCCTCAGNIWRRELFRWNNNTDRHRRNSLHRLCWKMEKVRWKGHSEGPGLLQQRIFLLHGQQKLYAVSSWWRPYQAQLEWLNCTMRGLVMQHDLRSCFNETTHFQIIRSHDRTLWGWLLSLCLKSELSWSRTAISMSFLVRQAASTTSGVMKLGIWTRGYIQVLWGNMLNSYIEADLNHGNVAVTPV